MPFSVNPPTFKDVVVVAPTKADKLSPPAAGVMDVPATDEEFDVPRAEERTSLSELTAMVWLALAPTWKVKTPLEPSNRLVPLKVVWLATRLISFFNWLTSLCTALRSSADNDPLAACTASSRIRCKLSVMAPNAPSAVCASEMPSLALRTAWFMPLTWVVIRSEIAKPAASSLALLMRSPLERRCIEVANEDWLMLRLRCAVNELMFVLITEAI